MDAATFFAQFWGWLTIVFASILFIRPSTLIDLKQRLVTDRSFALIYGLLSLLLGLTSVTPSTRPRPRRPPSRTK